MGRTYVAETAVQQYVDSLLSLHDSVIGLIVGQVTIVTRNRYFCCISAICAGCVRLLIRVYFN